MKKKQRRPREISDYDNTDTTTIIESGKPLTFADLGLRLPATPPTQVISLRLPTPLLNEIKALGSNRDVPYHSLIKILLAGAVRRERGRAIF